MCTLVETQWCKKALHPFTKVALAVTNCTSNKLGDGVARFITKTDILALKEGALDTSWTQLNAMPNLALFDKFKVFSKYCIRFVL